MWKRIEEKISNPAGSAESATPVREAPPAHAMPQYPERAVQFEPEPAKPAAALLGKSVHIRGELRASEDLYIDGQVEGSIELRDHLLTIGPSGKVQANINAKKVIILGSVKGNIRAVDSVDVRKSGSLVGDLVVAGISIAEGAYFKGSIDIQKAGEAPSKPEQPKAAMEPPPRPVTSAPAPSPSKFAGVAGGARSS